MSGIGKAHLDIVRHSLGLTRTADSYRNYFCAGDGHSDMPLIRDLCDAGLMYLSHRINGGQDEIYRVTDAGRRAIASGGTGDAGGAADG